MSVTEFEEHMRESFSEFCEGDSFVFSERALLHGLDLIGELAMEVEDNLCGIKDHAKDIKMLRQMQAVSRMLSIACEKYDLRIN
jgi:hypothetical protein